MSLEVMEAAASWPLLLPYFDGRVPEGSKPSRGLP